MAPVGDFGVEPAQLDLQLGGGGLQGLPHEDDPPFFFGHRGQAVDLEEGVGVGPEDLGDFLFAPQVILAFDLFGLGVEGRVEAAGLGGHFAADEAQDVHGDLAPHRLAGGLVGPQVQAGQLGLVVEHLLEVGHFPFGFGGVAVKAAADLVVDAAQGHGLQGVEDDVEGFLVHAFLPGVQQQL